MKEHFFIEAARLVLTNHLFGATKLAFELVQSLLKREIAIIVLELGTHHLERTHMDIDDAPKHSPSWLRCTDAVFS